MNPTCFPRFVKFASPFLMASFCLCSDISEFFFRELNVTMLTSANVRSSFHLPVDVIKNSEDIQTTTEKVEKNMNKINIKKSY